MKRMLATALVVVASCQGTASADQIPGSRSVVAGWSVAAYERNGKFSHCAMSAPYKSGITMVFSVSDNFSWRVGWGHDAWRFKKGQGVDLTVFVDDTGPLTLRAEAATESLAIAELPAKAALFDLMRKGYRMTVRALGNTYAFNLDGTYAGLSEIVACAGRYSAVASAPSSPPAPIAPRSVSKSSTVGVTAEQRLEATKIVANILAQGEMSGFRILTANEIAELRDDYFTKSDVVWKADGVIGTLRIFPSSSGVDARQIATNVVANDVKACKGQFVSGSVKDEKSPRVVRMFTGCQENKDNFELRYTVVPVEDGSFYLFATMSKANPSDRHSGAAKAEALLRQAVFEVMKQ